MEARRGQGGGLSWRERFVILGEVTVGSRGCGSGAVKVFCVCDPEREKIRDEKQIYQQASVEEQRGLILKL